MDEMSDLVHFRAWPRTQLWYGLLLTRSRCAVWEITQIRGPIEKEQQHNISLSTTYVISHIKAKISRYSSLSGYKYTK